ncbi:MULTISPECIES: DNA primase [Sorangium]|uniref:DNA primase n=1 Tax=Sorangium cellulosum TaxID=56 RepID=A0A4P2QTQ0_SORCE|nr:MULTISPECIES: DNA primase [Sorangium]AUX33690.1 DNA primase [Sorangium cellulosum]WCQ93002.1 DNA primase [Sorangium sp. Soce836]
MISPETIALVKERTDLVALIGESVRLTRRGLSFTGLCPFHKEKTPSFHVNPNRGFYHCFGCKETGSAIDFVMKLEGRTFAEAVRALAERAGIEVAESMTEAERREAQAARKSKDDLYAVNHLAATFFEHSLRGGPGGGPHPLARYAHEELARRGLPLRDGDGGVDPISEALQAFRIGYAPFAWDALATYLRQQGVSPVLAERVGLLVPRSSGSGHYDRFRHRLMFAVTDVMGRVIAFSGRALPDPSPAELSSLGKGGPAPQADGAPAKYINSPESPIYTKGEHLFGLYQARQAIRQRGEAVLVEGNFDVVALHARGIGHAIAPLGTAFTPGQAKLIKRFAPAVILLFDGDAAGKKATRAARSPCREAGLSARVAVLPAGVDPDDLARKHGPDAVARILKGARGLLEHLIDEALDGDSFGGSSLPEQLARVRAVAALLAEEDDPNLRMMAKLYADRLSSKLVIGGRSPDDLRQLERVVEESLSRPRSQPTREVTPSGQTTETWERARSRAQFQEVSLEILGAILDFPELLADDEVQLALECLEGEVALAIVTARQNFTFEMGLAAGEFLAQVPAPIHSFAAGRLVSPVFEAASTAKATLLENSQKLSRHALARQKAAVMSQLQKSAVDADAENALLRDLFQRRAGGLGLP